MRIGISGHQKIEPEASLSWVKEALKIELLRRGVTTGISCLAAGTDQIFAAKIVELNAKLEVVIPCENYDLAFENPSSLELFRSLKEQASFVCQLTHPEPSERAFLEGGQRVVDISECMFFVWDGEDAEGLGGTADIVKYALERDVPYIHLNPCDQSVTFRTLNGGSECI